MSLQAAERLIDENGTLKIWGNVTLPRSHLEGSARHYWFIVIHDRAQLCRFPVLPMIAQNRPAIR